MIFLITQQNIWENKKYSRLILTGSKKKLKENYR